MHIKYETLGARFFCNGVIFNDNAPFDKKGPGIVRNRFLFPNINVSVFFYILFYDTQNEYSLVVVVILNFKEMYTAVLCKPYICSI